MDQEKAKLQQEADSLAQRLEAVLNDKFEPRTSFDADTPIDKTLNFLQSIISVSTCLPHTFSCVCGGSGALMHLQRSGFLLLAAHSFTELSVLPKRVQFLNAVLAKQCQSHHNHLSCVLYFFADSYGCTYYQLQDSTLHANKQTTVDTWT